MLRSESCEGSQDNGTKMDLMGDLHGSIRIFTIRVLYKSEDTALFSSGLLQLKGVGG